ncbi:MAG: hypothetical protein HYR94_10175 [Chloroflexi bacterium]|nr:hypothetical protein [Chloroflexota bacterium]
MHRLYRFLPVWLRRHVITHLIEALPISDSKISWDLKLKRFVRGAELSSEDAHATWRMIFDAPARAKLLAPVLHYPGATADVIELYRAAFARTNASQPLNRLLYVDTRFYLPNDMLVKLDRMSMAHSLEAREPYLDYRLVEFAATVPTGLKLKHFWHKKYLLKASMQEKLPGHILWRKKQGFNVPNARWIKQGLKSFVMDHLSSAWVQQMGLLDNREVASLLHDHFAEKAIGAE